MAVEKKHFVCVVCPVGCEIDVVHDGSRIISMEGSKCEKSEEFVIQELIEPMRILTTTVRIDGSKWRHPRAHRQIGAQTIIPFHNEATEAHQVAGSGPHVGSR